MTIRWADGIIPATDESIKAYEIEDEVGALVADYASGHTFSGFLEISGEEQGDLSRLYVRGRRVVRVKPTLTWPAEEPLDLTVPDRERDAGIGRGLEGWTGTT